MFGLAATLESSHAHLQCKIFLALVIYKLRNSASWLTPSPGPPPQVHGRQQQINMVATGELNARMREASYVGEVNAAVGLKATL